MRILLIKIQLPATRYGIALFAALLPLHCAICAEWSIEPSISVYEEYNDNIRFTAGPHPKVWETSIRPNIKFSKKTEVSEISGQTQFGVNRYNGDASLNQNDQLILLFANHVAERNIWSMNASYHRDTTSELATTGIVQPRTQRAALNLSPAWTYSLSPRLSLKADYQYENVKYDSNSSTDYSVKQGGAGLQYALTEQDKLNLRIFYAKVDYAPYSIETPICLVPPFLGFCFSPAVNVSDVTSKSSTRGAQIDLTHLFSETMTGFFSLGRREVLSTTNLKQTIFPAAVVTSDTVTETRTNNYSLSGQLEKEFETGAFGGLISRDINPSGAGLVNTDRYAISVRKSLAEKLTAFWDASFYRTTFISVPASGSRYYTFTPKLNWRLSEDWAVDIGYRFARVKYDNSTAPVTVNAVYLNLNYTWPKIATSR